MKLRKQAKTLDFAGFLKSIIIFILKKAMKSYRVLQNNKHYSDKLHLICAHFVFGVGGPASKFFLQPRFMIHVSR